MQNGAASHVGAPVSYKPQLYSTETELHGLDDLESLGNFILQLEYS